MRATSVLVLLLSAASITHGSPGSLRERAEKWAAERQTKTFQAWSGPRERHRWTTLLAKSEISLRFLEERPGHLGLVQAFGPKRMETLLSGLGPHEEEELSRQLMSISAVAAEGRAYYDQRGAREFVTALRQIDAVPDFYQNQKSARPMPVDRGVLLNRVGFRSAVEAAAAMERDPEGCRAYDFLRDTKAHDELERLFRSGDRVLISRAFADARLTLAAMPAEARRQRDLERRAEYLVNRDKRPAESAAALRAELVRFPAALAFVEEGGFLDRAAALGLEHLQVAVGDASSEPGKRRLSVLRTVLAGRSRVPEAQRELAEHGPARFSEALDALASLSAKQEEIPLLVPALEQVLDSHPLPQAIRLGRLVRGHRLELSRYSMMNDLFGEALLADLLGRDDGEILGRLTAATRAYDALPRPTVAERRAILARQQPRDDRGRTVPAWSPEHQQLIDGQNAVTHPTTPHYLFRGDQLTGRNPINVFRDGIVARPTAPSQDIVDHLQTSRGGYVSVSESSRIPWLYAPKELIVVYQLDGSRLRDGVSAEAIIEDHPERFETKNAPKWPGQPPAPILIDKKFRRPVLNQGTGEWVFKERIPPEAIISATVYSNGHALDVLKNPAYTQSK
jgi:hypothetical protein